MFIYCSSSRHLNKMVSIATSRAILLLLFSFALCKPPEEKYIILKDAYNTDIKLNELATQLENKYNVVVDETYIYSQSRHLAALRAYLDNESLSYVKKLPYVKAVKSARHVKYQCFTQHQANWGLHRISGRKVSANSFQYANNGTGVTIYIVDTGVNLKHEEFGNRARFGYSAYKPADPSRDVSDHGTGVAALAAGATSGMAKGADIVSVRIVDDKGDSNRMDIANAFRWIIQDHYYRALKANKKVTLAELCSKKHVKNRPKSVVNLSMGLNTTSILVQVTAQDLIKCGIILVAAAGNNKKNACRVSPANMPNVITVGATDRQDRLEENSNYGPCVTVLAPGHDLKTASSGEDKKCRLLSGTSFAAPFVSGLAAIFLSSNSRRRGHRAFQSWLKLTSTYGVIKLPKYAKRTPNLLLFSSCSATTQSFRCNEIDASFSYRNNGAGVTIYVLGMGVNLKHEEFGNRARLGYSAYKSADPSRDVSNHGTGVAALAAGATSGVAKGADIVSVRITDDNDNSDEQHMGAGLQWIHNDHLRRALELDSTMTAKHICNKHPSKKIPKSVVVISMHTKSNSWILQIVIRMLIRCGIMVVADAGMDNQDVCHRSPPNVPGVVTAGWTKKTSKFWKFPSKDTCITVLAPQYQDFTLTASAKGNDTYRQYVKFPAAPLVSGLAAAFASSRNERYGAEDFISWLKTAAASGILDFFDNAK